MGLYQLHCDEQYATDQWQLWLQSKPFSINIAEPIIRVFPERSLSNPRVLFSLQFRSKKETRIFCLAILLCCLLICEAFTLVLPHILDWMVTNILIPIVVPVLSILFLLLWIVLVLSPLLILIGCHGIFSSEEAQFFKKFEDSGIAIHPISTSSDTVLFPVDWCIFPWPFICLFVMQILFLLGLLNIIILIWPLFLLLLPSIPMILSNYFARKEAIETFNTLSFWKLTLIEVNSRIYILFILMLYFYGYLYGLCRLHIAVAYMSLPLSSPNFNSSLAVDLTKVLKKTTSHTIDQVINYTLRHVNGSASIFISEVSYAFAFIMLLLTMSLFFIYIVLLSSKKLAGYELFSNSQINPANVPSTLVQKSSTKMINVYIFTNLILLLLTIIICSILGVTAVGVASGNRELLPVDWIIPFVWYQAVIETWVGGLISRILLIGTFAPLFLWLLMWLYSLLKSCWQLLIILPSCKGKQHRARTLLHNLCQQLKVGSPLLYIDSTLMELPRTTSILPTSRFCIIHLSDALTKELTDEQLTLILAHEVAHATLHARKLWLAQLFSRLALFGGGYLTLLLNYWKMEVEADEFAVRFTGNRDGFVELLAELPVIEMRAMVSQAQSNSINNTTSNTLLSWKVLPIHLLHKFLISPLLSCFPPMKKLAHLRVLFWNLKEHLTHDLLADLVGEATEIFRRMQFFRNQMARLGNGVMSLYTFHFGIALWGTIHPPDMERQTNLRYNFDRLTKLTYRVLTIAENEARQLQHDFISTGHLLIGLNRIGDSGAAKVLREMDIDLKTLQSAVAFVIGDSGYPVIGEIKLAARTELVLKCAIDIADTFNQQYVDTEHLLLALAQEDKGVVASVLKRLGIDRQRLRERAFQIVELSSK